MGRDSCLPFEPRSCVKHALCPDYFTPANFFFLRSVCAHTNFGYIIRAGLELSTFLFQPLEHRDSSLWVLLVPSHLMPAHLISISFCTEENGAQRLTEVTS